MKKATLVIYDSIEAQEPSKTYTCYRTTMAINNKLEEYTSEITRINKEVEERYKGVTDDQIEEILRIKEEVKPLEERASQLTLESIRLFFPNFTDEEFLKLDPYDYQTFCLEIGEMRGAVYSRVAKN